MVAARRPSRPTTAVCRECVISPSSAQVLNPERVAHALDLRRIAGQEVPAGPAGALRGGVAGQDLGGVVARIEADGQEDQVAIHPRREAVAHELEVLDHPRTVIGQRAARVDERDRDDFSFQRGQRHGLAVLIGELEVRHGGADRHQHRDRRRVLQPCVHGGRRDDVDPIDDRAPAFHRQAEPDPIAGGQLRAAGASVEIEGHRHRVHVTGKRVVRDGDDGPRLIDAQHEPGRRVMRGARG